MNNLSPFWKNKIAIEEDVSEPFRFQQYQGRDTIPLFSHYVVIFLTRITKFVKYFEHTRAIIFLKKRGLLKEYKYYLALLGVKSSMIVSRYFWYAKKLRFYQPERVLEIGSGAGSFALMMSQMYPSIKEYWVIDTSQMLSAMEEQIENFPHGNVTYKTFLFSSLQHIPSNYFDLVCSFTAFSEMEQETIHTYINLLYGAAKNDAIFYLVDRHKKLINENGIKSDNNPLTFPYQKDEILFFDIDVFHYETRTQIGNWPGSKFIRISRIKKNP